MKLDHLAQVFNVRMKSVRAATLKRLADGKSSGHVAYSRGIGILRASC